jgi:hypothetical protein
MARWTWCALVFGGLVVGSLPAYGDGPVRRTSVIEDVDESWYYEPATQPTPYKPNPQSIIHQKAMVRAQQRSDRLAAMGWYGMMNARPTAAPTPFTSLYSPVWQTPGGRPFGWYSTGRPTIIVR